MELNKKQTLKFPPKVDLQSERPLKNLDTQLNALLSFFQINKSDHTIYFYFKKALKHKTLILTII